MRKNYIQPEILFIITSTSDVLTASDEDVFIDGGDLFE